MKNLNYYILLLAIFTSNTVMAVPCSIYISQWRHTKNLKNPPVHLTSSDSFDSKSEVRHTKEYSQLGSKKHVFSCLALNKSESPDITSLNCGLDEPFSFSTIIPVHERTVKGTTYWFASGEWSIPVETNYKQETKDSVRVLNFHVQLHCAKNSSNLEKVLK